jgi:hypothetical protein
MRPKSELACSLRAAKPVQRVADAGDAEDGERDQPRRLAGQREGEREDRHQQDAQDGQDVGQAEHTPESLSCGHSASVTTNSVTLAPQFTR